MNAVQNAAQNAAQNAPVPTCQEWRRWINALPEGVWRWEATNKTHIKVQSNYFPPLGINTDKFGVSEASGNNYKRKILGLTEDDLEALFNIGNPMIPENEGGLRYEDICRWIHGNGRPAGARTDYPPQLFHERDVHNNYGSIFRRLHFQVNRNLLLEVE